MKAPASRRFLLTFALSGLCLVLAVLAFVPPPSGPEATRADPVAAAPLSDTGTAAETVAGPGAADGPAFRRPIFVPSRRLPGGGAASVDGLKLKAVFLGPGTKKALVAAQGGEPVWVSSGQQVAGWRVEEIHAEHLVLSRRGGGRRTLELEKPEAAPVRARTPSRRQRNTANSEQARTSQEPQ